MVFKTDYDDDDAAACAHHWYDDDGGATMLVFKASKSNKRKCSNATPSTYVCNCSTHVNPVMLMTQFIIVGVVVRSKFWRYLPDKNPISWNSYVGGKSLKRICKNNTLSCILRYTAKG